MKTQLLPALFGVCLLTALPLFPADAQMPFTASPMPNMGTSGGSHFGQAAPLPAQAVPSQGVPGMTAGMPANGYPMAGYVGSEAIDPDHKLTRGDRLSYRVVEDRDPTVIPLYVSADGSVNVPLIDLVKAQGKTTAELTNDIRSRLLEKYYYHATVILGLDAVAPRPSRGSVYLSGAVMATGSVPLPLDTPLTVSQAIAEKGGFKDFASKKVRVIRKGGPPRGYVIDVGAFQKGKAKDFTLEPEDQIIVDEKMFNF